MKRYTLVFFILLHTVAREGITRPVQLVDRDLESIVGDSTMIVLAERTSKTHRAPRGDPLREYVVKKVFLGAAVSGQTIRIADDSLYANAEKQIAAYEPGPAPLDTEVFLFLKRLPHPVDGALRVIANGHVYRFASSHLRWTVLPQKRFTRSLDPPPLPSPVSVDRFASDLRRVLRRVKTFELLSREAPSLSRNRKLLALLGPRLHARTPAELETAFQRRTRFLDFDRKILAAVRISRDLPSFYEGLSRADPSLWKRINSPTEEDNLRFAIDRHQRTATRVAALWLLEHNSDFDRPTWAVEALSNLLRDKSESVRIGAIGALGSLSRYAPEFEIPRRRLFRGAQDPEHGATALRVLRTYCRQDHSEVVRMFLARALRFNERRKLGLPLVFHLAEFRPELPGRLYRVDLNRSLEPSVRIDKREFIVRDAAGKERRRVEIEAPIGRPTVPEGDPDRAELLRRFQSLSEIANGSWERRLILIAPALDNGRYEFRVELIGKDEDGTPFRIESPPQTVVVDRPLND
ncbi:MAG: HEAT repeat domain-containing protein [Planctomycetota bacterium]